MTVPVTVFTGGGTVGVLVQAGRTQVDGGLVVTVAWPGLADVVRTGLREPLVFPAPPREPEPPWVDLAARGATDAPPVAADLRAASRIRPAREVAATARRGAETLTTGLGAVT